MYVQVALFLDHWWQNWTELPSDARWKQDTDGLITEIDGRRKQNLAANGSTENCQMDN